ncbi:hypothetical protein HMN09_01010000 [Mycena chlorophos]|uniref:Uncharacterized protein n=1 Tax=Mycena chlorophos TaxID=658473 RepID=A0A8H6SFE0_MYCCL|nr:hypothetical protein HMN09_01010000 [Mycena chlorophos]
MPPVTTKKRETYESKTRRAIVKLYTKFGDRPFTLGRLIAEVTAQGENGPHMLRIVPKNLASLVQSHLLKLKGTLDDGEREFQFTPEGAHKIRVIANLEQNDAFGEGKFANAMLQSPQKMTKKKLQETNFLLAETIEEQQDTIFEYRQRDKERLMNGAYISPARTPVASPLRKTASLPAGYFTPQSRPPRTLVIPQRITEFPSPPSSPTPHDAMDVDNNGDVPMADSSDDDHFMSPLDFSAPGHDDDDNESDELQTAHFNITKQLADREAELNAAKTDIARLQGQLAQRDASIEELNLELSTADQLVEHYDDYLARAGPGCR